ncbi:ATP-binding protein [Bacillus thuringiensis]|uniref:ATP-binding protein n=1 Tax=Bacillus thuringiensis TaxID=1428 RepID=UPI002FFE1A45
MEYIFLSGIHGVGKSTLAAQLEKEINIKTFSVSDLIRKAGNNISTSIKSTENISSNQDLWKVELNKLNIGDSKLLLDGHFCLLNKNRNINSLPLSTFKDTCMKKIICIEAEPQIIRERLLKRDKNEYSVALLSEFQNCELQQATRYSSENNISLFVYNEKKPFSELINFIEG